MEPTEEKAVEEPAIVKQEVVEEEEELSGFSKILASLGIVGIPAKIWLTTILIGVFFSAFISFLSMAPFDFPQGKTILIKTGTSLTDVSTLLSDTNIIRSKSVFEFCAKVVGGTKPVSAGQYLFKEPISACAVAYRIAHADSGIPALHITIPEGLSNKEIAALLEPKLPKFDAEFFVTHAAQSEGYLFPDTYFLSEEATTQEVENVMSANFEKKTAPFSGEIEASKHSLSDIVIMASILEREATTDEDRSIVSGILWNRIAKGMALQVDAPFLYILGKKSSQLTVADLQMKSPYNTYRNKGLPVGPINNPGLKAIISAIHPAETSYTYYLSDSEGIMHYSKTYAEHLANKAKYLK